MVFWLGKFPPPLDVDSQILRQARRMTLVPANRDHTIAIIRHFAQVHFQFIDLVRIALRFEMRWLLWHKRLLLILNLRKPVAFL